MEAKEGWGSYMLKGLVYVIYPFKHCDRVNVTETSEHAPVNIYLENGSGEQVPSTSTSMNGAQKVAAAVIDKFRGDGFEILPHAWTKDTRFTELPESIEDYFTPETLDIMMKWVFKRERIPEMSFADSSYKTGKGKEEEGTKAAFMEEVFGQGRMPVQLFNLFAAHEEWETIHDRLTNELRGISRILRRANLWNMVRELDHIKALYEERDDKAEHTVVHWHEDYDPLDVTSFAFLTETEDEGAYMRRHGTSNGNKKKPRRRRTGGVRRANETDCEEVFNHDNDLLNDIASKQKTAGSTMGNSAGRNNESETNSIGQVRIRRLLQQYEYYTEKCHESRIILNTFSMYETFVVQSLRELSKTSTAVKSSSNVQKAIEDQLLKVDAFTGHVMSLSRKVLVKFDDAKEMQRHTEDCFS